jgi:hypothetical protein
MLDFLVTIDDHVKLGLATRTVTAKLSLMPTWT